VGGGGQGGRAVLGLMSIGPFFKASNGQTQFKSKVGGGGGMLTKEENERI
jgi:hypothetical protein